MNADALATKVIEGIAVITLGSAKRIYFDAEMGDGLTQALDEFAGDPNIRVVIVTAALLVISTVTSASLHLSKLLSPYALPVASGRRARPTTGGSSTRPWRCARACQSRSSPPFPEQP